MAVGNREKVLVADPVFGKLNWDAIPYDDPVVMPVMIAVILGGSALVGFLTYKRLWGYLWNEWFTTIDHKKIGIMYIIVALVMMVRGFADAVLMRSHQALATSETFGGGYLPPEHYDQIFTAHAVIMIFFVATPLVVGFWNLLTPLQIGARDVAFPMLNNVSFWLFVVGVVLINASLFVGEFANMGWLVYPPLSGIEYSPWVGVDYWIWSLQISGIGTTLTAVNFIVTIIKMRAPGLTFMKLPPFTWTTLISAVLLAVIFPILTATIGMLTLDRYADTNFFTNELGGNQMMWVNLIWAWGHPEVYFLILPAFGIFAEVVPTFSKKPLFGYLGFVYATLAIGFLAMIVWLHHFFTMGSGSSVNAFFGIATMAIAIPTGVKIFNWLFTIYKGRVQMTACMYWTVAFLITFTIGGMTGVMLSIPAADFVLHNNLFLVAHFHNVIIGGAVFGYFTGLTYWWPKFTGFKLNEFYGKLSAVLWCVGFFVAFMPVYALGFMGAARRLNYYDNPEWNIYFVVAALGVLIIGAGVAAQFWGYFVSFRDRNLPGNRDVTGDPWNGRSLEWSLPSPVPFYNFAKTPYINDMEEWHYRKENGVAYQLPKSFEKIHMPGNTVVGPLLGLTMTGFGFGFVWHIWWLVAITFIATIALIIWDVFQPNGDYYVDADTVKKIEQDHMKQVQSALGKGPYTHDLVESKRTDKPAPRA